MRQKFCSAKVNKKLKLNKQSNRWWNNSKPNLTLEWSGWDTLVRTTQIIPSNHEVKYTALLMLDALFE